MPPTARDNFWGLGDIIRGIIATRQYCCQKGYEFILDIHKHPFAQFLAHDVSDTVASLTDAADVKFFQSFERVPDLPSPVILMSNAWCTDPTPDDKQFIRKFLTVKPEYHLSLPTTPYNVLHFRLGDMCMDGADGNYMALLPMIIRTVRENDVLCSDSTKFKMFMKSRFNDIRTYGDNCLAGHIGKERDPRRLLATLTDLQVLMGAQQIHTFSVYSWTSGFVDWIARCYDIPVSPMKL